MKNNYITKTILIALFSLLISCSSNTYKIVNSEYSYGNTNNVEDHYKEVSPILLNTKTGETWELRPEDEESEVGYKWIKQKKE